MVTAIFVLLLAQQTIPTQEEKELFDWFETLGVSRYLDKPFVSFGTRSIFAYEAPEGFLIEESNDHISILTTSLAVVRLRKSADRNYGPIVLAKATIRQTLADTVRFRLQGKNSDPPKGSQVIYTNSGTLAWLCHKFGMEREARTAILSDREFRKTFSPPLPASTSYLQFCKNETVGALFSAAARRLEQEDLSNTEVLREFERIRPAFVGTYRHAEIDKAIAILQKMIVEARIHVPRTGSLKEQIAEAIWQIPYQDRRYGHPEKVLLPSSDSNLRYSSVPQLIEALDDQRFLRHPWPRDSTGPLVDFKTIYWTPKVCDVAHSMLSLMFARYFAGLDWNGTSDGAKEEISRWYRAILKGGPKAAHLQSVRHGGYEAQKSFDAVVKDYPDEGLDALMEGYRNTPLEETGLRGFFAQTIARLPGKDALFQVEKICDEAEPQWVRISGTVGLVRRDPAAALPRMKREWIRNANVYKFDYDHASLVGPLYHAGSEGARVLAKDLRKQPNFLRSSVLTGFRIRVSSDGWPEAPAKLSREYLEVMENLFGSELDDLDDCYYSIPKMEKPRMCDVAMHELKALFPSVYSFNPSKALEPQRKAAIRSFKKRKSSMR